MTDRVVQRTKTLTYWDCGKPYCKVAHGTARAAFHCPTPERHTKYLPQWHIRAARSYMLYLMGLNFTEIAKVPYSTMPSGQRASQLIRKFHKKLCEEAVYAQTHDRWPMSESRCTRALKGEIEHNFGWISN